MKNVTVSPDARWIAAISAAGIHVWDALTAQERVRIPEAVTRPLVGPWNQSVAFSPDGRFLYSFHRHERSVLVWDLRQL
ncbi:MAG: hypothetical protein KY467_07830 [Gemmatimonadetes bacterium]|nr:hypothetical protein [Gemmatimonadota bacterium]